jgi:DnaJ-class molecular chaperone
VSEHWKNCDKCEGSGLVADERAESATGMVECEDCDGSGQVEMSPEEVAEARAAHAYDKWKADRLGV